MTVKIKPEDITDGVVEAVEDEAGMGHQAWDIYSPKEIIAAAMNQHPLVRAAIAEEERRAAAHGLPLVRVDATGEVAPPAEADQTPGT